MTERTVTGADLAPDAAVAQAAERLTLAARTGVPAPPVRDVLGSTDVALAYEVQNVLTAARKAAGARVVGRKVGLTSTAVQRQLGVGQPDFGVLFDDMLVPSGGEVDSGRLIAPKAEAEIAFVLSAGVDGFAAGVSPDAPISAADRATAAAAVDYAVAALEIVDSRVAGWDITITDTVADNASSALYVLGDKRVPLSEFAPVEVTMHLEKNGEPASSGNGAACLGDPLNALVWLARTAASFGAPLRAGDVVLSGALGAMVTAEPGAEITAELSTLGRVSVTFSR
ncbi:MAG: 2-keto-4-pentenoate hydratase [Actinomycetia bacterium]|nr:2-keto-4-pentenoate hydratase [Actinomycetes bacterium]